MRSETAKRIISETPDDVIQNVRDKANKMVEKTSSFDMQRMFEYMDKSGIEYTIDNNPSEEKIATIKASIARQEVLAQTIRKNFYENNNDRHE